MAFLGKLAVVAGAADEWPVHGVDDVAGHSCVRQIPLAGEASGECDSSVGGEVLNPFKRGA